MNITKEKENKEMTKEEMIERMIRLFGFEAPETISFARAAERGDVSEKVLKMVMEGYEKMARF